ncbi:MAG: hypothetical protein U5N55_05320 [Cypionkella sp.]|nr:hypothetical protein [Cypionkella sp.]
MMLLEKSMLMMPTRRRRSPPPPGDRPGHALFGIMQGGVNRELREASAQALKSIEFDGVPQLTRRWLGRRAEARCLTFWTMPLPFCPMTNPAI